jgi:hypothetical protein
VYAFNFTQKETAQAKGETGSRLPQNERARQIDDSFGFIVQAFCKKNDPKQDIQPPSRTQNGELEKRFSIFFFHSNPLVLEMV